MKFQRLPIALTVFNLGLLVFLMAQIEVRFLGFRFLLRSAEMNSAGTVLRGRALEITDVGKSSSEHQAAPSIRLAGRHNLPRNCPASLD
jgi:hypothetical protein